VVRLRKFMSLLQKTVQNHSNAQNAAAADEPESLVPTAATGHTHGEQPGGVYRLDIADLAWLPSFRAGGGAGGGSS